MGFASEMQDVANDLLGEFDESNGRIVLVKFAGEAAWDPDLAEDVVPPATDIPLTGVTVAFSSSQVNGTTIQQGDVMCIVQAIDPSIGISLQDKVKIDGIQWSIVDTPLVDYTGLTICHKIHCRK